MAESDTIYTILAYEFEMLSVEGGLPIYGLGPARLTGIAAFRSFECGILLLRRGGSEFIPSPTLKYSSI